MTPTAPNQREFVISYLLIQQSIGYLGVTLPWLLWAGTWLFGCGNLQDSISDFYYTRMGTLFTATLCALALFLFSYRGPERRDSIVSNIAAFFALLVAFVPTPVAPAQVDPCQIIPLFTYSHPAMETVQGVVHFGSAVVFLLTLAYMSITLFTLTDPSKDPTPEKIVRNRIYTTSGWVIVGALVCIGLFFALPPLKPLIRPWRIVFWGETVALTAFGFAWLVKGKSVWGIFEDKAPDASGAALS